MTTNGIYRATEADVPRIVDIADDGVQEVREPAR